MFWYRILLANMLFVSSWCFSTGWITYDKCDGYQLLAAVILLSAGTIVIAGGDR